MTFLHPLHLIIEGYLLLWVFLLFIANIKLCSARQCPPCGNQTIPYPLSTSSECGHPYYRLSCTRPRNQLQLRAISGSYAVRDIIPASRLLTLVPAPLLSHGASCISEDVVHQGLVLNQSQPFTVTPANRVFFLNCTQNMFRSPLNCSSSNLCHKAMMASGDARCQSLLCCMLSNATTLHRFGFPLGENGCSAYTSVVGMDESLPGQRWNFGVQLQWDTPQEPPCANQTYCPLHSVCRAGGPGAPVCRCNSGYRWSPRDGLCREGYSLRRRPALIAGLTTSSVVLSVILSLLVTALYRSRQAKRRAKALLLRERSLFLNSNGGRAILFSAKEMKVATDNYNKDRLLGEGGFGEVFKGVLRAGTVVAIKVARLGNVKGCDQVLNEVRILSQVNHRNLVRLLGCCIDAEQPILVYEYVPNGALLDHVRRANQNQLTWDNRLRIAKETAEGLSYLHSFACPPIIHRDVKSSNILLDANLTAKVSDFGLSRLLEDNATHISTCAQGTFGYLDPHYYRSYQLSEKSDVYSFGVVLLELVTSKRVIDYTRNADDVNLATYVCNRYAEGSMDEVLDPVLVEDASEPELVSMRDLCVLAMACSDEYIANRPRMAEVVHHIEFLIQKQDRIRHSRP